MKGGIRSPFTLSCKTPDLFMKKRILLLEDDPLQAEWISESVVWQSFPDAEIRYFDSEYSFLSAVSNGSLQKWNPQYALFDLLVRFYSPNDLKDMEKAPDVTDVPSPNEAGFRCYDTLSTVCPDCRNGIVTVLTKQPDGYDIFRKGKDSLADELIEFLAS